jgi:hypothetical protein
MAVRALTDFLPREAALEVKALRHARVLSLYISCVNIPAMDRRFV